MLTALSAILLVATPAVAQEADEQADTIPSESEIEYPQPKLLPPGATLSVPDSAEHGVFVYTRKQREDLEIRRRRDSARIANLKKDKESLRRERNAFRLAADTLRSALSSCRSAKDQAWETIELKNEAIDALEPGPIEKLINSPFGEVVKLGAAFEVGRRVCD